MATGLNVGNVHATAGVVVDERGFREYSRRLDTARKDARGGVKAPLRGDVDSSGFKRYRAELDKTKEHTGGFRASISKNLGGVRGAVYGLQGVVAGAGVLMAKSFADAASDINESLSKNRVLFGDHAAGVEDFANRSAKSFGIAKRDALEYTGTFGNLLRAIGVGQKESADTSVRLTKQAADMASFNNTTITDALDAIRSGLVGETEPLRRYGVTLSANSIAAEAMRSGLVKVGKETLEYRTANIAVEKAQRSYTQAIKEHGKGSLEARSAAVDLEKANKSLTETAKGGKVELTAQQKAQATLALLTRQTAAAQGDFGRTAGGAANQQRILRARLEDFRANTGAKLLGLYSGLIKGVNGFVSGMEDGTGVGGAFASTVGHVRDVIGGTIRVVRDVVGWFGRHRGATTALMAAVAGLSAALLVLRARVIAMAVIGAVTNAFAAAGAAVMGLRFALGLLRLAIIANPLGALAVGIIALGTALVVVYKRSETFRKIVNGALHAVRNAALDFADKYLGMVTTVLGGISSMATAASHIPGIGGKFKGVARDIDEARDKIDGYRESLRDMKKDHDAAGGSVDQQRLKIAKLRDAYITARDRQDKFKKGTDDYRTAARLTAQRADALGDAIKRTGSKAGGARRPVAVLRGNIEDLSSASSDTTEAIVADLNAVLSQIGAKQVRISAKRQHHRTPGHQAATPDMAYASGGPLRAHAVGGIPHPGSGAGDDHVLLSPDGRPVALMSGTEGILNTPQMGLVDAALGIANAVTGGALPGSLAGLWGMGLRHYAGGGIVAVPGFPGERAASSVIPAIESIAHRFNLILTDAYGQGHKSPGHTVTGTAADFAGPDANMDRAVRALVAAGYTVGYDGRFGSKAWPGHGPSYVAGGNAHLHVELGGKGAAGAFGDLTIDSPAISGPAGPLRSLVAGVARTATKAANRYIGRQAASLVGPDAARAQGADANVVAAFRRAARVAGANPLERLSLFEAGIVESGLRNLPYGDADSLGALQERTSIYGRGHALNPFASAMRFLRGVIARRPWRGSAGALAQAEQRSAFPGRYDQVAGAARGYLNRGGRITPYALGGLPRFDAGGPLNTASGTGSSSHPGTATPGLGIRALRSKQGDRIKDYDDVLGLVDDDRRHYDQVDRKYGQSDEELVNPETGELDQAAIRQRLDELGGLKAIRERIKRRLEEARKIARRVARTYKTIIERLTGSLRHAKKKERPGIRRQIKTYRGRRGEWLGKIKDLGFDVVDARLDVGDIRNEIAEVAGTKAEAKAADEQDTGGDAGAGDPATDPAADAPTPPTAEDIAAAAAAQLSALNQQRQSLYSTFGANFRAVGGPVGAFEAQAGPSAFGAFGAAGGAGGQGVQGPLVVNHFAAGPDDPHTWTQRQRYELEGLL